MDVDVPPTPDIEDGGRCLCGRDSTEGSLEDEALALQVCPQNIYITFSSQFVMSIYDPSNMLEELGWTYFISFL